MSERALTFDTFAVGPSNELAAAASSCVVAALKWSASLPGGRPSRTHLKWLN